VAPASPALSKGVRYKDMAALAAGAVRFAGGTSYTVDWGWGISSVTRGSQGVINITLANPASSNR
jgi:hypothetical protein